MSILTDIYMVKSDYLTLTNKAPKNVYLGKKQIEALIEISSRGKNYYYNKNCGRGNVHSMDIFEVDSESHMACA